jgi:hypothetical protein
MRVCSLLHSRHSRVGSSSGSGSSCGGRRLAGTCCRLTRMRVHVDDLPRMESTKTSSGSSNSTIPACLAFQRSRPARAALLSDELATTIKGILIRGGFGLDLAREGATLGPSDSILRKCGGHGASPRPSASSRAASSSSGSRDPGAPFIPAWGSPISVNRLGMVKIVNSAGSQSGTSLQRSGAETRASATGRTEYAEHVVRSLAFWL